MDKLLQGALIAVIILGSGYLAYSFVVPTPDVPEAVETSESKPIKEEKTKVEPDNECGGEPQLIDFWDIDPKELPFADPPVEILNSYNNALEAWNDCIEKSEWQTYRNEELGFEFKYPQSWGEVIVLDRFGDNYFNAVFSELGWIDEETNAGINGHVIFGAPSIYYVSGDRGGALTDNQGYVKENNEYFGSYKRVISGETLTGKSKYPYENAVLINAINSDGLLVRNMNFFDDNVTYASFNLENEEWPGLNFSIQTGYWEYPYGETPVIEIDDSEFIEVIKTFRDLN